jgi:homoserine O-acetyltransferase
LERLIKKHDFIDTAKFFVIAIDALGNGISSSPSDENKNNTFPEFSIRDMINSQYELLHDLLGFKKIYGAIGGSMGGMQVLEWSSAYPDYIERIFSYVGTPRLSVSDIFMMSIHLELIETLWERGVPEERIKPVLDMMINQAAYTPDYRNRKTPRGEFEKFFNSFRNISEDEFRVVDYYYQMKAMLGHDISKNFDNSMAKAANRIQAKVAILVSATDALVNPSEPIGFAEEYGYELHILDNDCGHLAPGCEMKETRKLIDDFFDKTIQR